MKKIYLLPNLFTTASLFLGLLAILNVFDVATSERMVVSDLAAASDRLAMTYRYELSCWLILASAILDMLDGWVARMTHTESSFGVQYDSLADLVAFGVAPAILIYTRLSQIDNPLLAEVITPLFTICGALRLARFNVQKATTEKLSFTGLPIPAAAGTVVSGFLFFQKIDPDWNREFVLRVLPVMMVGLSYLMVSNISYPSLKQFKLERRKQFNVLPLIVLFVTLALALKNYIPALFFGGFLAYIGWGIAWEVYLLASGRKKFGSHSAGTPAMRPPTPPPAAPEAEGDPADGQPR